MPRVNRAVLLMGTVAALLILGSLIGFGTLVYGIFRKPNHSVGLSECSRLGYSFFNELRSGRQAVAYHSISNDYRSRLTLEQFSNFLDDELLLTSHAFATQGTVLGSSDGPDAPLTAVRIRYTLMPARLPADEPPDDAAKNDPKANRRKLDLTLHFVEENGKWVVDQITFP